MSRYHNITPRDVITTPRDVITTPGPAGFVCECNTLYAGNGTACGIDTDGDGYPDNSVNCQGPACLADNCASYPNTDQVIFKRKEMF